jgi:hypothetical protein
MVIDGNDSRGIDVGLMTGPDHPIGLMRSHVDHPDFDNGGHTGTYGLCNAGNKIDYILLSPQLYKRVKAGGVMRLERGWLPLLCWHHIEELLQHRDEHVVAARLSYLWSPLLIRQQNARRVTDLRTHGR